MDVLFKKAVNEMFPKFNEAQRNEIFETVSVHMLEFLKQQVYKDDLEGLRNIELEADTIKNDKEREIITKKALQKSLDH